MVITYMIRVRCVLRGPSYHMTIQQKGVRNLTFKRSRYFLNLFNKVLDPSYSVQKKMATSFSAGSEI